MPLVPAADPDRPRDLGSRIAEVSDSVLDVVLVAFALWTAVFHLALILDWGRDLTAAVWVALLALAAEIWYLIRVRRRRSRDHAADPEPGRPAPSAPRWLIGTAAAIGMASALYAAVVEPRGGGWWPVWTGVVLAAGLGVLVALRFRPLVGSATREEPRHTAWPAIFVVGLALVMAALSVLTLRPDGDDVYVMNQALYVEARDAPFPERDTIFADQVFRDTRPDDVPASSIESLIGTGGRWLPFSTPTVAYLLLAPAVSFLAVLGTWRLARTLRAGWPALATAGAMAFLFLDGAENASFGNFSFARAWQGKVIAVFLLLPLVWHYALSWSRDGDRRGLVMLVAALVAAVGLSSTALAVIPGAAAVVLVAGAAVTRRWRRLAWATTAFVYPLVLWLVARQAERQAPVVGSPAATAGESVASGGPAAAAAASSAVPPPGSAAPAPFEFSGDLPGLDAHTLWYYVFGHAAVNLLVALTAMALTWVVLRDRASRLAVALGSTAVFGAFYAPGAAIRIDEATDFGSVLWRAVWIVPLPLMIGLLLAAPAALRATRDRLAAAAASVGVLVALFATGTPVIDGPRVADFGSVTWDVEPVARAAAANIDALSSPGAIAATPEKIGQAISSTTVDVRPVNPRGFEMYGSHAVPEFRSDNRRLLSAAVERGLEPTKVEAFRTALSTLRVTVVCVAPAASGAIIDRALEAAGFAHIEADEACVYWTRDANGF